MQSIHKLEQYFETTVPQLVSGLEPQQPPLWGSMNATQMLDHLHDSLRLAMGFFPVTDAMLNEKWEKYKTVGLMSERPIVKNFTNPIFNLKPPAEMVEHEQAKQNLQSGFRLFKQTFAENGETFTTLHNMFGYLNYHEWLWFQYKHFSHHFAQFNLIPYIERFELE